MKKILKPFRVYYKLYGESSNDVVLAYSPRHAIQVLIKHYADVFVSSPDCLTDFNVVLIPFIR